METTSPHQVEPRTRLPKAALILLALVGVLLLMQLGVVIQRVWADIGGGNPSISVTPDTTSDQVSATAAEFRVDESGAATYSVPLYTVPGTAGVAPQLSLSYSSQGGYGPLGMGWSIGGLSSVSRCRATRENGDFISGGVATDGTPQPINFTGSDRYCLDGQRLIPAQSGTAVCPAISGMTASDLRTEIESFQRVCAYTPSGGTNGPAFFTVERKDGSKSWYGDRAADTGDSVDGYFNATTSGREASALAWAQTRFQDSTGNYIDYLYAEKPAGGTAGEQLISEIRYTGKKVLSGQSGSATAPYAKVIFNYSARASNQVAYHWASAGQYVQSRRLDSVTVCSTLSCAAADQARHYVLTYATSVSYSGRDTLTSLKECRDSALAVCMAPTTFEWSTGVHQFATQEAPASLSITDADFKNFKLADINGDGISDLVYLRSNACMFGGEGIVVALGALNGSGTPGYTNSSTHCPPANLSARGSGGWYVFDYNGDGRDDLFISSSNGQPWTLHPSNGTGFDSGTNLISGLAIPSISTPNDQPQLADFNGDGLTDVLYPSGGYSRTRILERQQSGDFAWGAERLVAMDEASIPPQPECVGPSNNLNICSRWISGSPPTKAARLELADFDGDAASDQLFHVYESVEVWNGTCPLYKTAGTGGSDSSGKKGSVKDRKPIKIGNGSTTAWPYLSTEERVELEEEDVVQPASSCYTSVNTYALYAFTTKSLDASTLTQAFHTRIQVALPHDVVLGDANGDGLTDLYFRSTSSSNWSCLQNTGDFFYACGGFPNFSTNLDQARFVDINGDGRADILELGTSGGNRVYNVRYAQPDGSYSAPALVPGGNARYCSGSCDVNRYVPLFADLDADGNVDFLSIKLESSPALFVSRANNRHSPRDTITAIVNGFGARTELQYAPLTNNAVYRRDTGSRNGMFWGRGAPVQDLLAPMYVVARASSSAPQDGNPSAMASLYYRYAGAKVQAGGRGYLGFREIVTYDPNQVGGYVATTTTYSQNFPFVGMPARTIKSSFNGQSYAPSSCITGTVTNACYSTPGQLFGAVGGTWFADSQQSWEADSDNTTAAAAFAAGVQAPLHVRTLGTSEIAQDPFTTAATSRVDTAFGYGAYGNATSTVVDTYTGASTLAGSVLTANTYTDDATRWRLGRLTASTVTHQRPDRTSVVKTATFDYAMSGPVTGLMTTERTQPTGGLNQALVKVYALDAYGNRTRSTTCSTDIGSCGSTAVTFQPASATSINRYSRAVFDSLGRYPVSTYEPFWNGSGASEQVTQTVVSRNVFGDVTQAYNANGVDSVAVSGTFGRAYYSWTETVAGSTPGTALGGIDSLTTYRWCGSGGVDCPTGAKFRQKTTADGAPTQWVYFDLLGRPLLKAAETFNAGISGKDVAAVCTTYDPTGKPKRASNPFFVAGTGGADGPTGLSTACTDAARKWSVTTYDVLGRPTRVDAPDSTYSTLAYNGNVTTATDPRGKATEQLRNGHGELIRVIDALGTAILYDFAADGSQTVVTRDAGRGQVQNQFQYDARGRKIQQVDPDAGSTFYEYNALGELTAQQDAAGNRIEFELDARGRVWRKTVRRANYTIETQSTFTFDTAPNGLGQPAGETITGTYTDWVGQSNVAHSYSRGYGYDTLGRGTSASTTVDGVAYAQNTTLDPLGRPWKHQDASGSWHKTEYSARGYAAALCISDAVDSSSLCSVLWQRTQETDAWGNILREVRATTAQLPITREYNPLNGRQTKLCAGLSNCDLVNELYAWDNAGNLSTQQKEGRYLETFTYDNLNRLTHGYLTMQDGVTTNTLVHWSVFDQLGNICARLFQGQATNMGYSGRAGCGEGLQNNYGSGTAGYVGPHQLSIAYAAGGNWTYAWDPRGNQTVRDAPGTANDRTLKYSLDDQAVEIQTGNGLRTRYWYGADGQRYKREDVNGKKTLYLGQVEVLIESGATTYRRNIAGVLIKTEGAVPQANRFIFTDRLGSVVRYTDSVGAVIQSMDYDDWGQRRDFDTASLPGATPNPTISLRGYTGHEMVDGQDAIHMNARIYDPTLGRFLQADPLIQAPENAQSWNAYTYVFNNPLTLTDPTGMFSWRGFLSNFQQVFNIVAMFVPVLQPFAQAFNLIMAFASGGLKGGLVAAFASMIPGLQSVPGIMDNVGNLLISTAMSGASAVIMGGRFKEGAVGALKSAAISMTLGAIAQGVKSRQTGLKFASGADSEAAMGAVSSDQSQATASGTIPATEPTSISENGLNAVKKYESFEANLYNDQAGHATIGYGHLVHYGPINGTESVEFRSGITEARASELLRADLGIFERAVNKYVKVAISQQQYDAFVIFAFNIGAEGFRTSGALRNFNAGNVGKVAAGMKQWNKITVGKNKVVSRGLVNRRASEVRIFEDGKY